MLTNNASSSPSSAAFYLDAVITDVLMDRPLKRWDPQKETHALQDLAQQMVERPDSFLPYLVQLTMRVTEACSAGISLHEPKAPEGDVFRWHYLTGACSPFTGNATPRHASPFGVCLDRGGAVLMAYPERYFPSFAMLELVSHEMLMVPIYIGDKEPLGVLWALAHNEARCFDNGDAHMLTELARFAGIALKMIRDARALKRALDVQETLTREMRHRISNILTVAGGIVTASAKSASSVQELALNVRGRLEALGRAQEIVHHAREDTTYTAGPTSMIFADQLQALVKVIAAPYGDQQDQVLLKHPANAADKVMIGQNALTALGLILHELATNAAKYGALSSSGGRVVIDWNMEGDICLLTWTEVGGPPIVEVPKSLGFGSNLIKRTVAGQLDGGVKFEWHPAGLHTVMRFPLTALAR